MSQTETAKTHVTQVGRVIVPVSDQDRAIEFYTQKLGFELRADIPYGEGDRWVEVAPAGAAASATAIALVPPRAGGEDAIGSMTGIALTTSDVGADHADLRARGVDVDPEIMGGEDPVPAMFFLRDQDGNSLLIVEG